MEGGCLRSQKIRPAASARPTPRHNNGFLIGARTGSDRLKFSHNRGLPSIGQARRSGARSLDTAMLRRAVGERSVAVAKPSRSRSARAAAGPADTAALRQRGRTSQCPDVPRVPDRADSVLTGQPVRVVCSA